MATSDNENNALPVVILAWCLLSITTTIIVLRIYVRQSRLRRLLADDYFMVLAWLCQAVASVFLTTTWRDGVGHHIDALNFQQIQRSMKYNTLVVEPFAISSSLFGRISFCTLLLFILERAYPWRRAVLWGVIILQIIVNSITIIQILAQCGDQLSMRWSMDPSIASQARCQGPEVQQGIGYAQGTTNSVCDLILVIMPVIVLWSLQLPWAHKFGIGIILTLSIFACAASVSKTVFIQTLAQGDITWRISYLNLTQMLENNVVMIASSIPTLRPLLSRRKSTSMKLSETPNASNQSSWRDFSNRMARTVGLSGRHQRGNSTASVQSNLELCAPVNRRSDIMKTTAYGVTYEDDHELAAVKPETHPREGFLPSKSDREEDPRFVQLAP